MQSEKDIRSLLEGLRCVSPGINQALREESWRLERRILAGEIPAEHVQQELENFEYMLATTAHQGLQELEFRRHEFREMRTAMPDYEDRSLKDMTTLHKAATAVPEIDGFIAAAANNAGLHGTNWGTTAWVANPTDQTVTVTFYAGNANVPASTDPEGFFQRTLAPGQSAQIENIMAGFPGVPAPAAIFYKIDGAPADQIVINSRTFTLAPHGQPGSLGQGIPGMLTSALPNIGQSQIAPLTPDPDLYRANVGVLNAARAPTNFRLRIRGSGGAILKKRDFTLPPLSWVQFTNVFDQVGMDAIPNAYAELISMNEDWTTSGTNLFYMYGSIVDNQSGDPTLKKAQWDRPDENYEDFIPAVAHLPGAMGTFWRTDVDTINWRGPTGALSNFIYLPEGQDNCPPPQGEGVLMSGNGYVHHPDVVLSLFGQDRSKGALWNPATTSQNRWSRTYTVGENGSFGQGLDALERIVHEIKGDDVGHIVGLEQTSAFRTNVGLANPSCQTSFVVLTYFDSEGNFLKQDTKELEPHGMYQFNWPLDNLGDVVNGRVEIQSDNGVLAYASRVDNETGDAASMVAQRVTPINLDQVVETWMQEKLDPFLDNYFWINVAESDDLFNESSAWGNQLLALMFAASGYSGSLDEYKEIYQGWFDGNPDNSEICRDRDPVYLDFRSNQRWVGIHVGDLCNRSNNPLNEGDELTAKDVVRDFFRWRLLTKPAEYGGDAATGPSMDFDPTFDQQNFYQP